MSKIVVIDSTIFFGDKFLEIKYYAGNLTIICNGKSPFSIHLIKNKFLRFVFRFRLFVRLFRMEPTLFKKVDENVVIFVFKRCVYRIDLNEQKMELEHCFRKGMSRPLDFCVVDTLSWCSNIVLYGEYFQNMNQTSVCLFGRDIGGEWKVVFKFEEKLINHIHNVVVDEFRDSIIVLTGDLNSESFFWEFRGSFVNIKKVCGGLQAYRSCNLFPSSSGWLFASDSPVEDNYIYFLENPGLLNSNLIKICPINGPSIYSIQHDNKYCFSTSVEPCVKYSGVRYLLTKRKAKSIRENSVFVYCGNKDEGFNVVYRKNKDSLPAGLFQFGNVTFLHSGFCDNSFYLLIRSMAVHKDDGKNSLIYL